MVFIGCGHQSFKRLLPRFHLKGHRHPWVTMSYKKDDIVMIYGGHFLLNSLWVSKDLCCGRHSAAVRIAARQVHSINYRLRRRVSARRESLEENFELISIGTSWRRGQRKAGPSRAPGMRALPYLRVPHRHNDLRHLQLWAVAIKLRKIPLVLSAGSIPYWTKK